MAILSCDYGHGCGQDRGAEGILIEETCIRQYGPVAVGNLMRQGHTLIDCTPPAILNLTLQQSLQYRVDKANASGSILHICFHVNASGVGGHGEEIEVASDTGAKYAQSVFNEICKLGFTPRNINRPGLYVTANTKMPAILLEPFFCDSKVDCDLYNCNTLGNAVSQGIVNIIGGTAVTTPKPPVATTVPYKEVTKPVENIVIYCNSIDQVSADQLADFLKCPTINGNRPYDYSNIKNVYWVGGPSSLGMTSYVTVKLIGVDRNATQLLVANFIANKGK